MLRFQTFYAGVAEWQTQQTQNLPVATPWGFDPPSRHHSPETMSDETNNSTSGAAAGHADGAQTIRRRSKHRRHHSGRGIGHSDGENEAVARKRINIRFVSFTLPSMAMIFGGALLAILYTGYPDETRPGPIVETAWIMLASGCAFFAVALVFSWIRRGMKKSREKSEKRERDMLSVATRGKRRSSHRRHRHSHKRRFDE